MNVGWPWGGGGEVDLCLTGAGGSGALNCHMSGYGALTWGWLVAVSSGGPNLCGIPGGGPTKSTKCA
eukprot:16452368-Heterocapsa_arctica.AAC.2